MNASAPTVHRWLGGGGHRLLSRAVGAYLSVILDIMRDRTTARGPAGFIPSADLETVILRGLWVSICDGCDPMALDEASRIWAEEVVSQGASAA